jgi:hypothetical protein
MGYGLEDEMLPVLVKNFPKAFFTHGRNRPPLRVGIFEDLDAALPPEIDRTMLKQYLGIYTKQPGYLRELTQGAARIDLNGNPAGRVSEREAASAKSRLEKSQAAEPGPHVPIAAGDCLASTRVMPPLPRPACRAGLAEAQAGSKSTQTRTANVIVVLKKRRPYQQTFTRAPSVRRHQGVT